MVYLQGTHADTQAIARLHALSWEQNYRGEFSDHYLDHEVWEDRLKTWTARMENPSAEQYVIMAKEGDTLCGFACVYLRHDPVWGALLDNLHVLPSWKKNGIGRKLMQKAAEWVWHQDPTSKMYLWVLESNAGARKFYERIGGQLAEKTIMSNPGGGESPVLQYVWPDLIQLVEKF